MVPPMTHLVTRRRPRAAILVAVGFALSLVAVAPAGRSAAQRAAGPTSTGPSLTIFDPFAVSPTVLAFGPSPIGSTATNPITLVNDTARQVHFEAYGVAGVSVTGIAGCGSFIAPAGTTASLSLDVHQTCDIDLTIDISTLGPVAGQVILTDTVSGAIAFADVTAEVVPAASPANDNWVNAQDLSLLVIPAFVGVPGLFGNQQPRDTVEVLGSTVFATYEPGEYASRPGGSLWYKYTAPPGGFTGRLGYRATPGFFVAVSTENTSVLDSWPAGGNSWPPSGIKFVRMEPGHTVYFSVYNEFVDPGRFALELFQAPNEQDSIVDAYGSGSEDALTTDFNLLGDGDTHHLSPDLPGGAPNGWFTLRFAVAGTLSVTYRSATAKTLDRFGTNEGSERPLGLRIYRSPQPTLLNDPTVLGAPIAVGTDAISADPAASISGPRWETTATVPITPGRYYWTFERGAAGPTFFITNWRFTANSPGDTEPPTATISTPPDGAQYAVGSVPSTVVSTCTDNQGASSSFVTVDGRQTTSLATTVGSHTVSLECTDAAGNTTSITSTYAVVPDRSGPCVIVETQSVDFGDVVVGSASPTRAVVVRSCSDAPIRLAANVSNATSGGGARAWLASTLAVLTDNQFTWSVTPPGGQPAIPVGLTQTLVGPPLAAGASRTDQHRVALGPTGLGLGLRFTSVLTYTALAP